MSVSPSLRLVLGSASPRRAELLKSAGFDFDVRVADVDERIRPGEAPEQYVRRLAQAKSAAVHELVGGQASSSILTLGADTAVVVDGDVLGKPADEADAGAMIERLSGRDHEVLTGVSLRRGAAGSRCGRADGGLDCRPEQPGGDLVRPKRGGP